MRVATKNIYRVELVLQVICLVPMTIGHLGALIEPWMLVMSMIAQFVIGCVQVLGGLGHYLIYKDKGRGKYLLCAIGYLLGLWLGTFLMAALVKKININLDFIGGLLMVLSYIIIPSCIALWYTKTTFDRFKLAPLSSEFTPKVKVKIGDKDLLDDGLIYNSK